MSVIGDELRRELRDPEYSEGYTESFLNAYIATQTKVIREQRELTQAELARLMGTTQTAVSRIENVNYSAWNIKTLKKLARALHVRLKVSFETYGTLPDEVLSFGRNNLKREAREHDPGLWSDAPAETIREAVAANQRKMLAQYAARLKNWMDVAPAASQPTTFAEDVSMRIPSGPLAALRSLTSADEAMGSSPAQAQAIWTPGTGMAMPEVSAPKRPTRSAKVVSGRAFRRHRLAMRGKRYARTA